VSRLRHNTARPDFLAADEAKPIEPLLSVNWTLFFPSSTAQMPPLRRSLLSRATAP
jgi:hypothetical protein